MGPLTPSGSRLLGLNLLLLSFFSTSFAQTGPLFCVASADPLLVRSEGLAERLGDILLECSGGIPGRTAETNLTIFLPVNVTNRLSGAGTLDTLLSINTGAGFVPSATPAIRHGSNAVAFNGLSFTIPASGQVALRVSNLRGAANQFGMAQRPIQASLSFTHPNPITLQNNQLTVAIPDRGLLAAYMASGIPCVGSPLPSPIDIPSLIARGTASFSARMAEGIVTAFQARDPLTETNGTRIISRYSNFPANARLFVPDVLTGSSSELLLMRVIGTDSNGAGGMVLVPGSAGVSMNSAGEISLANGAGIAVYEVIGANPNVRERFELPTWMGLPPPADGGATLAMQEITFGPVSTVTVADAAAPVTRFANIPAIADCEAFGDCGADYYPRLVMGGDPLQFSGMSGGFAWAPRYIQVRNDNIATADMYWTATVAYKNGSGWLRVEPSSGWNNATIRLDAALERLAPGRYEATLTLDAGLAGSRTLPVVALVTALPDQPKPPQPPAQAQAVVTMIGNAASPWPGALVAGSLASIKGSKLQGANVSVTFDDIPSQVLRVSDSELTVLVPAELTGKSSARMTILVDGTMSGPHSVSLAAAAPAIFPNGVLNEDNSVNGVSTPAMVGSYVQIFATGLLPPVGRRPVVTAKIHDREVLPVFAGASGGSGVHQVNVRVPEDLPAMTTEVLLCVSVSEGEKVCSLPVNLTLVR